MFINLAGKKLPMSRKGTAVVSGANSGIGHAFAQVLVKEGWQVRAIDRDLGSKIRSLGCTYSQVDVSSPSSITAFKQQYFANNEPLDLLLNIAGVMNDKEQDSLEGISLEVLNRTFSVNTFGPLLLTQALLPNILNSQAKPRRIAVMSSRVGSIADNTSGGNYAYRSSKTAVNSIFKNMSVELGEKGVVVSMLHPGFVDTNMIAGKGPLPLGTVQPAEAADKLWLIMQAKGSMKENNGKFWHREGFELPW